MNKPLKTVIVLALFLLLILVRGFASKIFYDPLSQHFENDYLYKDLPDFDTRKLFFSYFLRYTLNALISLVVIYVVYPVKTVLKFSFWFYIAMFFLMICTFYIAIDQRVEQGYLLIYYIRRFIIHPLFVLILIPAFYYSRTRQVKI